LITPRRPCISKKFNSPSPSKTILFFFIVTPLAIIEVNNENKTPQLDFYYEKYEYSVLIEHRVRQYRATSPVKLSHPSDFESHLLDFTENAINRFMIIILEKCTSI